MCIFSFTLNAQEYTEKNKFELPEFEISNKDFLKSLLDTVISENVDKDLVYIITINKDSPSNNLFNISIYKSLYKDIKKEKNIGALELNNKIIMLRGESPCKLFRKTNRSKLIDYKIHYITINETLFNKEEFTILDSPKWDYIFDSNLEKIKLVNIRKF